MPTNNCFIRSLNFQNIERTPIWIMRQAGRYLPEYHRVRKQAGSFLNLCKNADLASTVTLQPLERFDLDAAIIFSDILVVLEAIGFEVDFVEKVGPIIKNPIERIEQIDTIQSSINDNLIYVSDAIKTTKKRLDVNIPLIGFAGSPWTLFTYAIEGGKAKDNFFKSKQMLINQTQSAIKLLNKITDATTVYLDQQVKAGVDCLMIFDSWGGILAADHYQIFSLAFIKKIILHIKTLHPNMPMIIFSKSGGLWLESIADSLCDAIGLDWHIDIASARNRLGVKKIALQGNMDPIYLTASNETITKKVNEIIQSHYQATGSISGHIFNLGHGITPNINPDKVKHLVNTVHEISSQY